jgi:hypothetical protein
VLVVVLAEPERGEHVLVRGRPDPSRRPVDRESGGLDCRLLIMSVAGRAADARAGGAPELSSSCGVLVGTPDSEESSR